MALFYSFPFRCGPVVEFHSIKQETEGANYVIEFYNIQSCLNAVDMWNNYRFSDGSLLNMNYIPKERLVTFILSNIIQIFNDEN